MTESDKENFMAFMCLTWPGKFPADAELVDWFQRLRGYRLDDIQRACNEHKNTNKFRPQVSELLARLKGKTQQSTTGKIAHERGPIDELRNVDPQLRDVQCDVEVVLRYYRKMWVQYVARVNDRSDGQAPAQREVSTANAAGFKHRLIVGMVGLLVSARLSCESAKAWAEAALDYSPDNFRVVLDDLRARGAERVQASDEHRGMELVSAFAGAL